MVHGQLPTLRQLLTPTCADTDDCNSSLQILTLILQWGLWRAAIPSLHTAPLTSVRLNTDTKVISELTLGFTTTKQNHTYYTFKTKHLDLLKNKTKKITINPNWLASSEVNESFHNVLFQCSKLNPTPCPPPGWRQHLLSPVRLFAWSELPTDRCQTGQRRSNLLCLYTCSQVVPALAVFMNKDVKHLQFCNQ